MDMARGFVRIWVLMSAVAALVLLAYVLNHFAPAWVNVVFLSPLFVIPFMQIDEWLGVAINWIKNGFNKDQIKNSQ